MRNIKPPRRTKADGKAPILLAVEDTDGMLNAWCPFCASFHHHGKEEGMRTAHCDDPKSPFNQTGYLVKNGTTYLTRYLVESDKG
ncbi:hypothetical protein D3C74_185460 [compost metagenome]